jgi:hypothetical protein
MPGKCKFLNKWLEQPQYHAWLRKAHIFIKHTGNAATKVLTFPPWENRPSKVI